MSNSHSLSFVNGSIAKVIMAYIFAEEIAGDQKLSTVSQFFSNGVCIKKKNTYIPLYFKFLDFLRHFSNNY